MYFLQARRLRVFLRLLLLFTLLPLAELYLLIKIGSAMGAAATILLVLSTGALGAILGRRQGIGVWTRIQERLSAGEFPGDDLIDGLLVFAAGMMLLTPGILTDTLGFMLLAPPTRRGFRTWLKGRFSGMLHQGSTGFSGVFYSPRGSGERDVTDSDEG